MERQAELTQLAARLTHETEQRRHLEALLDEGLQVQHQILLGLQVPLLLLTLQMLLRLRMMLTQHLGETSLVNKLHARCKGVTLLATPSCYILLEHCVKRIGSGKGKVVGPGWCICLRYALNCLVLLPPPCTSHMH